MHAILCEKPGTLTMVERAAPVREDGEVLVRIRRVGVCGTDLHIFGGNQPYLNYPRVMGHELAGTVEAAPPASGLSTGEVVYIVPYLSCGTCDACRAGKPNCCRSIQVLGVHRDGGMASHVSIPARFVHSARGVSLDEAAMVEFLAIGAHAARRAEVTEGQSVLVAGAGPIGLAAALFAAERGGRVIMLDPREDRLDFSRRHLPVAATVRVGEGDEARLADLTDGAFFDVVFDATGNPRAMERGFRFVAHGGRYVLVSIVQGNLSFSDPEFHKREMTLLASRNATDEDFETVMTVLRAGRVPTDALVTHRMAFDDVPVQFPSLLDPARGVVKAMIEL